ncbi:putative raffinose synthase protein Sip1 [Aspergillus undulatus]|uniref:putative raffinose synthase protein Sip1 n=1 Tax=Aspergillus undulatus TaxID=1810928 RepID=UPI003CCDD646
MTTLVTTYPALSRVTCLQSDKVIFAVLLESDTQIDWEVQIWHNIGNAEWSALALHRDHPNAVSLLSGGRDSNTRQVFAGETARPPSGTAQFTVRYRDVQSAEWQWANREQQASDGELIFSPSDLSESLTAPSADGLGQYFEHLSPDVEVEIRKSESPGAALWRLSGAVEAAQDGRQGTVSLPLGVPFSVSRFFALTRTSVSWLGPRQGKTKLELSGDAILCSFLRTDGVHVVLFGVSVDNIQTVLRCGSNGEVVVKSQNDNATPSRFQVLAAAASEFEIAMGALIYEARKLVRPYGATSKDDVKAQWLSSWYDSLTYCTWNGVGQDLTEERIFSALDELKVQGIQIKGLIIDDNWQSLDNEGADSWHRGWTQFEANPKAFPQGLAKTVSTIRERHPNIEYIAVWHALLGYWGGISPEGELASTYKTKEVQLNSTTRPSMLAIDPSDIQRFYNDFYSFVSSAGITGVKADAQSFLDLLRDPEDRKAFTTAYQDAWSISSLRHFGPKVISCMSQFPQAIFHSQLPTNKPTIVARNSDDFFPNVEDSHAWHVFCNAHNALLTRYLNVLPDWDMFQTSHPYAAFHAAARCVSGGPIYITDTPAQHNILLIKQMTAPTIQDTIIILRPALVGRTLDMYESIDEGHILRIGTYHGGAGTGSGIMGLFNVSSSTKSTIVPVTDFPGVYASSSSPPNDPEKEKSYIVRAHRSGKIADALTASSTVAIRLHKKEWEILTAYPAHLFTLKDNTTTNIAILGLLGKMAGVAALVNSGVYIGTNGRLKIDVALKALGVLGIYFSNLPSWDIDEHFMVLISGKPVPRKTVWKEDRKVLAVDVEEAWKGMELSAGWGGEVWVSVLV